MSPRTWKVRPFTPLAASVHSHTTIGAIFAGGCESGVAASNCSSSPRGAMVIAITSAHLAVATEYSEVDLPSASGRIALQRTPKRPSSRATVRVSPTTPSFAAAYATADGCPNPDPDDVLTITPDPCPARCGVASRIIAK